MLSAEAEKKQSLRTFTRENFIHVLLAGNSNTVKAMLEKSYSDVFNVNDIFDMRKETAQRILSAK